MWGVASHPDISINFHLDEGIIMSDAANNDITVHLRFRSPGANSKPVTVSEVQVWLERDADIALFARQHDARVEVMISDGHSSEVIDFDGTRPDDPTIMT